MRVLCNPTKFRIKTNNFDAILASNERMETSRVAYRGSNESEERIHELGSTKNMNFEISKKIGPRVEKMAEMGFEAYSQVENSEGAV